MKIRKTWFFAAAMGALCLASLRAAGSLSYETSCVVTDPTSVDGNVTNLSQDTYQVMGQVRFIFSTESSMTRHAVDYTANALVPPGRNVRVARVRLPFQIMLGETCRLDVKDAVRKL